MDEGCSSVRIRKTTPAAAAAVLGSIINGKSSSGGKFSAAKTLTMLGKAERVRKASRPRVSRGSRLREKKETACVNIQGGLIMPLTKLRFV